MRTMQLLDTASALLALVAFIVMCAVRVAALVKSATRAVTHRHRNGRYWERLEAAYARYEATAP